MSKIKDIFADEILDSRGNPTVRVSVGLKNGIYNSASVPSGASTGKHEAHELRDGDKKRYGGKGVLKAVENVNKIIAPKLRGKKVFKQRWIDELMCKLDGTDHKSNLGANAILGVSLACAKVAAENAGVELYEYIRQVYSLKYPGYKLPKATMNVLNGGAHAGWILDFQEYMIVPQQKTFAKRLQCGSEVFHELGKLLKKDGYSTLKGDEGGYAPALGNNERPLEYLKKAITSAKYKVGKDVTFALDPAVSELFVKKSGTYKLKVDKKELSSQQLIDKWEKWLKKYPIESLEDGLAEDDWQSWQDLTKRLGKKVALVGDDLFVTNVERLQKGIDLKVGNAILIKVNQIGTLSEAIDAIELAHQSGYKTSISHRSGETEDTFIADLAVAVNSEYIKTGSLSRSERVAKYNRLLAIEQELQNG